MIKLEKKEQIIDKGIQKYIDGISKKIENEKLQDEMRDTQMFDYSVLSS